MTTTHRPTITLTSPSQPLWRRISKTLSITLLLGSLTLSASGCDEAQAATEDDNAALMERLAVLESKEEIRTTMLKFSQVLDDADVDGLKDLEAHFTEDIDLNAIDFDGTSHRYVGMEELVNGYMPFLLASPPTLAPSAINVELTGDSATATFKFTTSIVPPPQLGLDTDQTLMLFAANTVEFVYEDDTWKVAAITLAHSLAYPGSLSAP